MESYEKASGKAIKCSCCTHRGVCAFSKELENFEQSINELCEMPNYQHFGANIGCGFFMEDKVVKRNNIFV